MAKYQVTVTDITHGIPLIKALRTIADLGLKEAKDLADFLASTRPCILVAGIDREVAEHVVGLLHAAGANAKVGESSIPLPMLLCPEVNRRYRWSWLAGRVRLPGER
jgi:hypothetical protein